MSSISIAKSEDDGKFTMITIEEAQKDQVAQILSENYTEKGLVDSLFNGGNIVSLASTVEDTVFSGEPAVLFESVDSRESEITMSDYNFLFTKGVWLIREFGKDFYLKI